MTITEDDLIWAGIRLLAHTLAIALIGGIAIVTGVALTITLKRCLKRAKARRRDDAPGT
ncbi:hypothetical protein ACGFX2_31745 [Streptomyces goshikiensis]|uniref:hypothetical protein n=1 Tax=Streptomyces goshikiensis TaxID=1942 RepID=UPI00371B8A4B